MEEGFLTFTSLPGGLLAKVGKFREQIGKVNTLHSHALPWVDGPLVLTNLLGSEEGIADSGISVSKLVLNPWFFLEATGEVYQGNSGALPVARAQRPELRRAACAAIATSPSRPTSTSAARSRAATTTPAPTSPLASTPSTRPSAIGPLRRAIYRRLLGRTELFWSRREQEPGEASAFGMYASGDYQFGAALVRRRALRLVGARRRPVAEGQGRSRVS